MGKTIRKNQPETNKYWKNKEYQQHNKNKDKYFVEKTSELD